MRNTTFRQLQRGLAWASSFFGFVLFCTVLLVTIPAVWSYPQLLFGVEWLDNGILTIGYSLLIGIGGYGQQKIKEQDVPDGERPPRYLSKSFRRGQAMYWFGSFHILLVPMGVYIDFYESGFSWATYFMYTTPILAAICIGCYAALRHEDNNPPEDEYRA